MRAILCADQARAVTNHLTLIATGEKREAVRVRDRGSVKLKVGQTRAQVRSALGTPLLADVFHGNRWDYMYEFNRQGRTLERRRFTVYFADDKLARWEGDEMPPSPVEVARSGGGDAVLDKSLSIAPKTGEENWFVALLKKLGWMQ